MAIKDEFISTLKLKIENLEKLHGQDEWKLSQADDNLEMVERKASAMERKAVGKLTWFCQNSLKTLYYQKAELQNRYRWNVTCGHHYGDPTKRELTS